MVDKKVTQMDLLDVLAGEDLIYVIDDPNGAPASKKIPVVALLQPDIDWKPIATGGSSYNNGDYKVHTFTSGSSYFVVTQGGCVEYLIVAGGGGGGGGEGGPSGDAAGGGGGGGLLTGLALVSSGSYLVVVGNGGDGATAQSGIRGENGENSSFGTLVAIGGGGGGSDGSNSSGAQGGSGGGAAADYQVNCIGGACIPGQGHEGGYRPRDTTDTWRSGAGGGGAGAAGQSPRGSYQGIYGKGLTLNIAGSNNVYADGGLGGPYNSGAVGANGGANTGDGGGGGGGDAGGNGGNGGSGIVIIRYKT